MVHSVINGANLQNFSLAGAFNVPCPGLNARKGHLRPDELRAAVRGRATPDRAKLTPLAGCIRARARVEKRRMLPAGRASNGFPRSNTSLVRVSGDDRHQPNRSTRIALRRSDLLSEYGSAITV